MSSELDWTGITIDNGQCEYPDCPWCARHFLTWYKARINQMSVPRAKKNETISFAEAAGTSIVPHEVLRSSDNPIDDDPLYRNDREIAQDETVSTKG